MICSCQPERKAGHRDTCSVAQAMRWRCPECKSRRRAYVGPPNAIAHAAHCKLKEFQP